MDVNWFHCEPEIEERMHHTSVMLTPCEILRQVYAKTEDPELRELIKVATTMIKSMAARISQVDGKGWGQLVYPQNLKLNVGEWKHNKREGERIERETLNSNTLQE